MKILMTLETPFPPDKRVENEIDALSSAGYSVHIICYRKADEAIYEHLDNVKIHRIEPGKIVHKSSVGALRFPLYFNYWKREIKKVLIKERIDIVHVHDLPLIKPVLDLKQKFGFKIVLDLHENWPGLLEMSLHTRTPLGKLLCNIEEWKIYERKFIPEADGVIVVVEEALERIRHYITDSQVYGIVSNTINLKEFKQLNLSEKKAGEKIIFIYEGGITYHRGLHNVIRALNGIRRDADWEFVVVGSGSYLPHLKELTKSLGLSEKVIFTGWQPLDKIYKMLSNATVALIPHLKSDHTDNTIPHKLFHYIYSGLPVIASDCNPLSRIIEETGSGIIYRSSDIEQLTEILSTIADKPATVEKYTQSRQWIESKYNWSVDAENIIKLYSRLNEK
jgi:glycosyltransferase involved in cell wall biosynthesis